MNDIEAEVPTDYKYFVLKNGARITSFRVLAAEVGFDIKQYIQNQLCIYPNDAEIYPINREEYLDIQRINRERRRIFRRIRNRNIEYKEAPKSPHLNDENYE